MKNSLKVDLSLLLTAMFWGLAFPLMKITVTDASVTFILGLRFLLAAVFLLIVFFPRFKKYYQRKALPVVFLASSALFFHYLLCSIGLKITTAINGGFYTGIYIVFVPFLLYFFDRDSWSLKNLLPVFITLAGIYFLSCNQGSVSFNNGDILCLAGAVFFALYIVLSGVTLIKYDAVFITVLQMAFVGFLSLSVSLIWEGSPALALYGKETWINLFILAVLCSALPFLLQHYAQPHTTPLKAAIIFSSLQLFSVLGSMIMLGEKLYLRGYLGGALIITAIVIAQLQSKEIRAEEEDKDGDKEENGPSTVS